MNPIIANDFDPEIQVIESLFKFTTDDKLKWFGYGEWIEEVDFLSFTYKSVKCHIIRIVFPEGLNGEYMFGGHLCGYVELPLGIPVEAFEVHGGITFEESDDKKQVIGFDCAHCYDYVPSMAKSGITKKLMDDMDKIFSKSPLPDVFKITYKNMKFCIDQCKGLVNQILVSKI